MNVNTILTFKQVLQFKNNRMLTEKNVKIKNIQNT